MSGRRIGNYLIGDYLGGGGFGSVFKAEDTSSPGRIVAIKELHKKHTRSSVIKQRFFQEAVAMARLDHPNLPRLYTFGEDNGSYYLVMEFLQGKLLTDVINDKKQLPPSQALTIITQVLEAVSYAHRNGIIHRDLKPDNIMLTGDANAPKVKVLDFGIARMVGGENLTMAGEGFGTPTYMSPERIAGGNDSDNRADIYSLGIILYEMLSGKAPFASAATDPLVYWSEMRTMHESHELPSLDSLNIPANLQKVIQKAAAKTLEYRYPSADEMLADLLPAAQQNAATVATGNSSQLLITTVPPAAEVYVDEAFRGASDATNGKMFIDGLSQGLHNVRVSKGGYNEYSISVVLEDGKRTELQVPLAARSTIVMPQVSEATAPMDAKTVKMESGDEVATAMLVLEEIPAGSQVFVGFTAMGQAGDDGCATVKLAPGVHELQVKTPTGEVSKRIVTLTEKDAGSFKTMVMPFTTDEKPSQVTGQSSFAAATQMTDSSASSTRTMGSSKAQTEAAPTKKKLAMAAVVVLLLALAASAYFALRKPTADTPQDLATASQQQNLTTPQTANGQQNPTSAAAQEPKTDAERQALEKEREQLEREKKALEKKEQSIAEAKNEQPKGQLPPPQEPPPPVEPSSSASVTSSSEGTGCVGVRVAGPNGQAAQGVRVMFVGGGNQQNKRTGANGLSLACGFPVGSTVKIIAMGMGVPVVRELTVKPGTNGTEIRLERPMQQDSGARPTPPASQVEEDSGPKNFKRGGRNMPFRKRPPM
jgi:serine/threonine protein kinase